MHSAFPPDFRAGFVTFVGRPNAGKSTLTNALVGEKIAITSPKPQTTRRAIRAIVHRDQGQLIIVDTPGMHRPKKLLGQRLNEIVQATISDVDVIGMCFPAGEPIGPGDRYIHEQISQVGFAKKVALVTKTDTANKATIAQKLLEVADLGHWDAIIPVSAVTGEQLEIVVEQLLQLMPLSPALYAAEQITEETDSVRIAELIRESALAGAQAELPHSLAATVVEMQRDDAGVLNIYADLFVERESQKAIVLGKKGAKLATIKHFARREIAKTLGEKPRLHLQVKVLKEWQNNPKALNKLGF